MRMTERQWLKCTDYEKMLTFLGNKLSVRKMFLFGCACCRLVWDHMEEHRQAVEVAERWADDVASTADLEASHAAAEAAEQSIGCLGLAKAAAYAAVQVTSDAPAWDTPVVVIDIMIDIMADDDEAEAAAKEAITSLLRHIAGNPFKPYFVPASWPAPVVQLATALYKGQDCSFALHDALLEAGHSELAEHFKEKDHPKGCWAMDTILGKK
jgi:hypothetical protein